MMVKKIIVPIISLVSSLIVVYFVNDVCFISKTACSIILSFLIMVIYYATTNWNNIPSFINKIKIN